MLKGFEMLTYKKITTLPSFLFYESNALLPLYKIIFILTIFFINLGRNDLYGESFDIDPLLGKNLIHEARTSAGLGSTTFSRREQKSVIHKTLFSQMIKNLAKENIKLENRDQAKLGKRNSTFTIYSQAASFNQGRIKTKIRLRARFYITKNHPYSNQSSAHKSATLIDDELFQDLGQSNIEKSIERSKITEKSFFLEIKIKNPSEDEENSVLKIRMNIEDHLLKRLYKADPNSSSFIKLLDEMKSNNSEYNKLNHAHSVVSIIQALAKQNIRFIRPQYAVSYERNAYAYTEQIFEPSISNDKDFGPEEQSPTQMTFQITTDQNIKYYKIDRQSDFLNIIPNYYESTALLVGTYPPEALAIEFKEPSLGQTKDGIQKRSPIHQALYDNFVTMSQESSKIFYGYQKNNGKAANCRKRVEFKNRFILEDWENIN